MSVATLHTDTSAHAGITDRWAVYHIESDVLLTPNTYPQAQPVDVGTALASDSNDYFAADSLYIIPGNWFSYGSGSQTGLPDVLRETSIKFYDDGSIPLDAVISDVVLTAIIARGSGMGDHYLLWIEAWGSSGAGWTPPVDVASLPTQPLYVPGGGPTTWTTYTVSLGPRTRAQLFATKSIGLSFEPGGVGYPLAFRYLALTVTYTQPIIAPTLLSVAPNTGTFCGGATVALTGTGFSGTPTVTFDGVEATSVTVISPTSLTCVVPEGLGGPVDVVVTNPDGQSATLTDGFTYTCGCRNAMSATTLVYAALRLCNDGLLRAGRAASAEQLADGLARLNDMLNAWSTERLLMFYVRRTVVPLTTGAASYTIGDGGDIDIDRPERLEAAGLILDTTVAVPFEQTIEVLTDQRWALVQQKGQPGALSYGAYFDRGWTAGRGRIYPWPVPSAGPTSLVLYTLQPLAAFADLVTCYTFPQGYGEAIRYQLALRLAREFGGLKDPETTTQLARTALARVKKSNIRPDEANLDTRTPGLMVGGVNMDGTQRHGG